MDKWITQKEIEEVQQLWAKGIVDTGKNFLNGRPYDTVARKMIEDFYGYNEGPVLFKPTKARDRQFRLDTEGALSYFVGGNENYPEDHGFALKPWMNVRFENAGFVLKRDHAIAMGNYFFKDKNGFEMKVEFTIGLFRTEKGQLKINLHHSSLPYS